MMAILKSLDVRVGFKKQTKPMAPAMLGSELVQQVSQGKDPKGRTLDPSPGLQSHDHFMTQPCFSGVGGGGGHFMNQSSFLTSLTL